MTGVRNEGHHSRTGPRAAEDGLLDGRAPQLGPPHEVPGARAPAPMAFAIGLHPGYEILANFSGRHEGYDELEMGAGVLGETLELVKCETVDLEVPAQAEIVIEGIVPPGVREPEDRLASSPASSKGAEGPAPVFEVTSRSPGAAMRSIATCRRRSLPTISPSCRCRWRRALPAAQRDPRLLPRSTTSTSRRG